MAGLRTGYPGLTYTAEDIAKFIGPCDIFCEPFAGLGRVSKFVKANNYILNDMSDYAYNFLSSSFINDTITKKDFVECVLDNNKSEVTFFFGPPWVKCDYALNPKTFCDRGVGDYYKTILHLVPQIKGMWYVAGRNGGGARSTVSVYFKNHPSTVIYSHRKINGHNAATKIYYKDVC